MRDRLKWTVRKLLRMKPMLPYDDLLTRRHYTPASVELLGETFRVSDGRSFYWSYKEIFHDEIYRFESPRRDPRVIDLGANYGTSIVYFKSIFPAARITAVEADPEIFAILSENIERRRYRDVELLHRAVCDASEPVAFHSEGSDGGRLHTLQHARQTVMVDPVRLDDLIDGDIDFLKIDIEGAEADVICGSDRLSDVRQLFIEYHSFADSPQLLAPMLEALSDHGFRYYIHTQFCSPRPLIEQRLQLGMDLQLNVFAKRN